MHAKCAPGKAPEVARLIEAEYLPQLSGVEGTVSYTLVHLGQDEITSLGVFMNQESAQRANELAVTWARERLADLGAAPLEAHDGDVLTHTTFGSQ